jgi:hypothetical protein
MSGLAAGSAAELARFRLEVAVGGGLWTSCESRCDPQLEKAPGFGFNP